MLRPESRGLHYNLDHADLDPAWAQRDSIARKGG
jgi:aspartate oxidase